MSTFGHTVKNPAFIGGESDPVHIAAGKVLQENELRNGKTVTRVPLGFKLVVALVFIIAVVAIVLTVLFYTGTITPLSDAENTKQQGRCRQS